MNNSRVNQMEVPTEINRKVHGLDIASRSEDVRRIEDDYWQVRSQTLRHETWYNLVHTENGWVCDCPDMQLNKAICKHSHAMKFFMKIYDARNGMTQVQDEISLECKNVRIIAKNHYAVESSTSDKSYRVEKLTKADVWVCECKDFHHKLRTNPKKPCKHIRACMNIVNSPIKSTKIMATSIHPICPKCNSTSIIKSGFRTIKNEIKRQRYFCQQCKRKFILGENGFSKVSSDPKIITESLSLIMSGVSYRNTSRHIKVYHDIDISYSAICKWVQKYTQIMKTYVEKTYPKIGPDVWSLDEMVLNVKATKKGSKGFSVWLWTIVDPQTRYIISTEVSKTRKIDDARSIIVKGKNNTSVNPSYVVTDSLQSYEGAIRKELDNRRTAHIKTKAIKNEFANRPIERVHNEMRETLSARRGLGNDKSSQNYMELFQIHHNLIRPHMGLNGKTPGEVAGISPDLGKNKYRTLIQNASTKATFVSALKDRTQYVNIDNNGERIRVTQKCWLDKKVWREINDILSLYGFEWISNEGRGFWQIILY